MATVTRQSTLLSGPGSYASTGTIVPGGSNVIVKWQEGGYYYVEYGTVRGYVATLSVTLSASDGTVTQFTASSLIRWNRTSGSVDTYYGPSKAYERAGSINGHEQVTYLGEKDIGTGYAFIEYSTSSGPKRAWVDSYYLTDTDPNPTQTTYYATLSYNANGGSGAPSAETFDGTSLSVSCTISPTIPARSGYDFVGWASYASSATATYFPGQTKPFDGSTSGTTHYLYAVWQKNKNGGVVYIGRVAYAPYIYTNGEWKPALAHIYSGWWKKTREE